MANITNTTQVSLFSLVKAVLKTNSTLNQKFRDKDYYQFQPSFKTFSFSSLPIIIIRTPTTITNNLVLSHTQTEKEFDAEITIIMDFNARGKFDTYVNAIIAELESSEATFESSGYYNLKVEMNDSGESVIQSKSVVTGILGLSFTGGVSR